jgi:hypothetical protein
VISVFTVRSEGMCWEQAEGEESLKLGIQDVEGKCGEGWGRLTPGGEVHYGILD